MGPQTTGYWIERAQQLLVSTDNSAEQLSHGKKQWGNFKYDEQEELQMMKHSYGLPRTQVKSTEEYGKLQFQRPVVLFE